MSVRSWKSLLRRHKQLPPLSLKFRTFGMMSASAMASAQGLDQYHCDLCGQAFSGTRHFALSCSGLDSITDTNSTLARVRFPNSLSVPVSRRPLSGIPPLNHMYRGLSQFCSLTRRLSSLMEVPTRQIYQTLD